MRQRSWRIVPITRTLDYPTDIIAAMDSIRLAGLAALLLAGCYGPNVVECTDGFLCPEGTACAAAGFCGEPARVEACLGENKPDLAGCQENTGSCYRGVCEDCNADLAGCHFDVWTPMSSPARESLYALWVASEAHAYAGGADGELLEWDGRGWRIVPGFATTIADITSIWGTSANDLYVAAGSLFHFDGTAWTTIDGITGAKAVGGSAANDVYVVGTAGMISHFDGASWQALGMTGPDFEDVAVGTQMIAVGSFGAVFTSDGTTATGGQPLPMAIRTAPLQSVTTFGASNAIVVGLAVNGESEPVIAHFDGTAWTAAQIEGAPGINMRAVWAADDGTAFAGGYQGNLLRLGADGRWTSMPKLGGEIEAIDGSGRHVFAVGAGIWRYSL